MPHFSAGNDEDDAKSEAAKAIASGISESAQASKDELLKNLESVYKKPDNLISGGESEAAMAALIKSGGKGVSFQRTQGFDGIEEYEPPGWHIEVDDNQEEEEPTDGANQHPAMWPSGVGMALMNGCYGSNYAPGDPCYMYVRPAENCPNLIDAAGFIGVGFDGRGYYSSDSRKMSIIQRICDAGAAFLDKDIP